MKRKIMDEKGRFFGVISVVDILVVLLALGLAAMVYLRFFSGQEADISQTDGVDIPYTVEIAQVRQFTVDALRVGDSMYLVEDGTPIGTITAIETQPATQLVSALDGTVVEMAVEEYSRVTLSVLGKGTESSGRYYANRSYELNANASLAFNTKYVSSSGVIRSVG